MAEVWPVSLDYLLDRGTFTIDPNDSVTRTEFDDGPVMVRQRFSNPTTIYNGSLTLTNSEFMIFRGFYLNILNQGTKWFTMPIWVGDVYAVQKVRFKKQYEVTDQGFDQYSVTISLEVRNYFTYDYFTSYILGFFGLPAAETEVADPIQQIVNVEYPDVMYLLNFPYYVRYLYRAFTIAATVNDIIPPIQIGINSTYPTIMAGEFIATFTDVDNVEYIVTFTDTDNVEYIATFDTGFLF